MFFAGSSGSGRMTSVRWWNTVAFAAIVWRDKRRTGPGWCRSFKMTVNTAASSQHRTVGLRKSRCSITKRAVMRVLRRGRRVIDTGRDLDQAVAMGCCVFFTPRMTFCACGRCRSTHVGKVVSRKTAGSWISESLVLWTYITVWRSVTTITRECCLGYCT